MMLLAIVPFLVLDVHGQISIPPPANSSDSDYRPITVRSNTSDTGYLDGLHVTDLFRDHKKSKQAIGDLFFQAKTYLLTNDIFKGKVDCLALVNSVKSLLDDKKAFPGLAIPDNITPNKKKDIVALGFDFYKNNRPKHCSPNFDTVSTEPIITDKEFRVTIYDKSDKEPYYFSPRDNITTAQIIPACSSTNFDTSDKTLKGDTTMCYGTNGDDMVIITKRLAGFYGAADTVTSSDPRNLDLAPPPKPPTISTPSAPAAQFEHFNVTSQDGVSTGSFESPGRYTYADPAQGDIYIPQGTTILSNPILEGTVLCTADVWSISSILAERNVQGLAAPTNVVPSGALVSPAVGIDFRPRSNSSALCSPDLEAPSTDPLITSKELQVTLYDKSHKKPYYFSPRDSILAAMPIPECSSINYDEAAQTLKTGTPMCYGINGTDIVIVTNRLAGFYGSADSINVSLQGLSTVNKPKKLPYGESLGIQSLGSTVGGQFEDSGNFRHGIQRPNPVYLGHIYIPPFTTINSDSADFSDTGKTCSEARLRNTVTSTSYGVPPNTKGASNGFGFGFFQTADDTQSCTLKRIQMVKSHETNTTMYVTLYDQAGKKGFSYSPLDSDYKAISLPQCNLSNFNFTGLTLLGDTKGCYHDNADDLVIFTKRLEWYGAATEINDDPATPNPNQRWTNFYIKSLGASNGGQVLLTDVSSTNDATQSLYQAYMPLNAAISPSPLLADNGQNCLIFKYSYDDDDDDFRPPNVFGAVAVNLIYKNGTDKNTCQSVNIDTVNAILKLNDTVRITLKGKSGLVPFYTDPIACNSSESNCSVKSGLVAADTSPENTANPEQLIPKCTSATLNTSTGKLIGSAAKCYTDDGTNLIIYTKNLEGYGAKIDPNTPYFYPPHSQFPTTNHGIQAFTGTPLGAEKGGLINADGIYLNAMNGSSSYVGSVYIEYPTKMLPNPDLDTDIDKKCIQFEFDNAPDTDLPNNTVNPKSAGFEISTVSDADSSCTIDLSASDKPLLLDREIRIQLDGLAGKKPFFISPREDITQAQPIPTCDNTNSYTNQTLKAGTDMCAVDYDGHLIIISKRLGFYGSADRIIPQLLTITPPTKPDGEHGNFTILGLTGSLYYISLGNATLTSASSNPQGELYLISSTNLAHSDPTLPHIPFNSIVCRGQVVQVKNVNNTYVPNLAIPDNINPATKSEVVAIGINFFVNETRFAINNNEYTTPCQTDLEATSSYTIDTVKEIRYTIYGKHDKEPYYFSPRDNIPQAQPIDPCTTINFDITDQTLKDDTKMCYGKHENNMVIVTKRLTGFYGAADSVTVTVPSTTQSTTDSTDPPTKTPSSLLPIPKPDDMPEPERRGLTAAYNELKRDYWYIRENKTLLIETLDSSIGDVRVPSPDRLVLEQNPLLDNYKKHSVCPGAFQSVGSILKGDFTQRAGGINTVVNLKIPSNIEEQTNDTIIAGGINWSPSIESDTVQCPLDLEEQSNYPIFTTKELRYTLYNQSDKKAYHFSPRENILAVQPILPCDNDNFDITDQTLKGDTKMCYGKHEKNMVIITKKLTGFYGATTGITVTGTGDDDGDVANAPTFGTSPLTGEQLVTCGYKMDDTCRDITAYHVQYERDVIQTNTTHTFTLKALAPNMIDSFTLAFGVPEIGSPVSAAEAYITAKLAVNYTAPSYYNIIDVIVHDPNNIIDYNITNTEVSRVSCSGGTLECSQVTFPDVLFRETLYHEPFVVMITDTLLYTSINYMNEGILVTGTPLNEQPTISPGITVDTGDTRPTKLVLVRTDKVNDLWADAFGNTWSRNSFGNYVIVQYAPYAGTVPVCDDINDRLCAPFKAKLDWHNQRMIELRDSLYAAYTTKEYVEIDNIFTYEFGDTDTRTRTLTNLGWLTK